MFDGEPDWHYTKELENTLELKDHHAKPRMDNFYPEMFTKPENFMALIYPKMRVGKKMSDMREAKKIIADLRRTGVTKPRLPNRVWDVSFIYLF